MSTPLTIPGIVNFHADTMGAPGLDGFAITASDTTNFNAWARAIYVGGAGTVVLVTPAGTVLTFVGAAAGSIIPCMAGRVNATNTTATSLIGLV